VGSGRTRWAASWWADAADPVGQEIGPRTKVQGCGHSGHNSGEPSLQAI
jgi:hypothetical protein